MTWRSLALACVLWWCATAGTAQAADDVPLEPRAGSVLRDRDFGVQVRGFGLDRRVEMLQWQRVDGEYRRVWHDATIDARTHDAAHDNPRLPVRSRRWWSDSARIDGRPIAPSVLQSLGAWKTMRPDFAALPGQLAARYQPEGDGLGSSENPLEPDIGDVRITWRQLMLPPLTGRIELRRDVWQLRDAAPVAVAPSPLDVISPPTPPAPVIKPVADDPPPPWPWIAGVLAIAIVLVTWGAMRLRGHAKAKAKF